MAGNRTKCDGLSPAGQAPADRLAVRGSGGTVMDSESDAGRGYAGLDGNQHFVLCHGDMELPAMEALESNSGDTR